MLSANLTLTSNGTGTKPGSTGALAFVQIATALNNQTVRRVVATATTTPQLMTIGHQHGKTGWKERIRSVFRYDFSRKDTDASLTGGIIPAFSFYAVLDRPVVSNGYITTAHMKDGIGYTLDALMQSGNIDNFLNEET
jgi:hypothetical protein